MPRAAGSLRHQDRLQRSAVFQGSHNDPLTAFHDLSESMTGEVLAIVSYDMEEDEVVGVRRELPDDLLWETSKLDQLDAL